MMVGLKLKNLKRVNLKNEKEIIVHGITKG